MTTERIPLVPPEVDLRDFSYMPLEFERLFASDTWVLANPEEKVAALHLWCKSWHQVPAASLPDDDRILAHLSAAGPRWKKIRQHALRGWVKCTDGRLYHPRVAEKALKAWAEKLERRTQTHNARIAAMRKRVANADTEEARVLLQGQLEALLQEPVTGSKGREGKGREGKEKNSQNGTGAARQPGNGGAKTAPAWEAYTAAYQQRYGHPPTINAEQRTHMARFIDLVPLEEAPLIAAFYVAHNKTWYVSHQHDLKYLKTDAAGLRTQWLAKRQVTDTSARATDRTAARGQVFTDLIEETKKARVA